MRPLSELLADMSQRAKAAEDNATAARNEGHEQVDARIAKVKADAQNRSDAVKARAAKVEGDVTSGWASLQAGVRDKIDEIHGAVGERRKEHDTKVAQRRADRAEENAVEAIEFALYAIDEADEAVLEAIDARLTAAAVA